MPAGICIISIVKCLQYINLGISDFFQNISQAQGCCFQRFCCSHNERIEIPAGFLIGCLGDAFVSCDTDDFLNKVSFPYRPHERTA